jgi:hypothetical protein
MSIFVKFSTLTIYKNIYCFQGKHRRGVIKFHENDNFKKS